MNCKIAWAAGILEGEGCFSIFKRSSATWNHKTVAIHCEMTDEDTIVKLRDVFDVGTILKRDAKLRNDGRSRQNTWIWSVQNHDGVFAVLTEVMPWLGQRRKAKALELLEYINECKSHLDNT